MSDEIPDIETVRREIDRVDNALLDLIAERLELSAQVRNCLLYTSPSPRDGLLSRMPSSA